MRDDTKFTFHAAGKPFVLARRRQPRRHPIRHILGELAPGTSLRGADVRAVRGMPYDGRGLRSERSTLSCRPLGYSVFKGDPLHNGRHDQIDAGQILIMLGMKKPLARAVVHLNVQLIEPLGRFHSHARLIGLKDQQTIDYRVPSDAAHDTRDMTLARKFWTTGNLKVFRSGPVFARAGGHFNEKGLRAVQPRLQVENLKVSKARGVVRGEGEIQFILHVGQQLLQHRIGIARQLGKLRQRIMRRYLRRRLAKALLKDSSNMGDGFFRKGPPKQKRRFERSCVQWRAEFGEFIVCRG